MEVFVARQPILTARQTVYGYELLFRSGLDNYFTSGDGDAASAHVIDSSYFVLGLDSLTAGSRAFINFTRQTLMAGYATLLPPSTLVVEVLEDVAPDDEVVQVCLALKGAGYRLALDDYVLQDTSHPLLPLVDILKVDFGQLEDKARRAIPQIVGSSNVTLLAEKVETPEDFAAGVAAGYTLFQGYFFARPRIVVGRKPEGVRVNHLRILEELGRRELHFGRLEELTRRETGLVYKILRYVNSAAFGMRHRVTSVRHALALMGEETSRRLLRLMVLGDLVADRPSELIRLSAARAYFCEEIAQAVFHGDRANDLFLLGLFSAIDAILEAPLDEILGDLPLPAGVADALLGRAGPYGVFYELMLATEQGAWDAVDACTARLGLAPGAVGQAYTRSLAWAWSVLQ